ncbi:Peptidoglycan-N-acetylglucosamine deacetylase [Planktothrix tepida]|uniref:Polysaccharide deacetylase n=1 Tax=Planktothrix tepida PCC 9214 TaxID=671072 RepID=A0A1J1LKR2_9CYAN|nr:polysaccharide deacetylase family protein [Planktothrix tepida]CAD5941313.1 Peptidoglycan-N-acetylglucosamine deacetylase [Planktothrix tepida]CUR33096.1 Polysaccharide deacetylase [Planktothrix tepida PCC 9214]
MAQYSPLLRQQKVALFALVAAIASFAMGVMLPLNLRVERATKQSLSARSSQPPRIISNITEKLKNSSSEIPSQPLSQSGLNLQKAITQRVDNVQKTLEQLQTQRFSYSIPEQFQSQTIKEVTIPGEQKVIAFTFDDGPWPKSTRQILDILEENNIKATFFWVGSALKNQKDIAKVVVNEGHVVGNHTWSHRYQKYSPSGASEEIESTAKLMEDLTGINTPMFRPPGGVLDNGLVDYAFKQNHVNIMWSVDSQDWKSSSDKIISNVLKQAKSGGIILMHDGGGDRSATVKALPIVIKKLKEQGYTFVTIPELLKLADQKPVEQPQSTDSSQP